MTERLLQYIWQQQYYNTGDLATASGERLTIIYPGRFNSNQGADFIDARIRIDSRVWAGNVELHLRSSDWSRHTHDGDPHYTNVVLHVVWYDDGGGPRHLPLLELNGRVPLVLIERYRQWMISRTAIPCSRLMEAVPPLVYSQWLGRLLIERIERKAAGISDAIAGNGFHWQETYWQMLARSAGLSVNADVFEDMARSIPVAILFRLRHNANSIVSLLAGQVGLFNESHSGLTNTNYLAEYRYQAKKFGLRPTVLPLNYLRMRPASFPERRIAQLAAIVSGEMFVFSRVLEVLMTGGGHLAMPVRYIINAILPLAYVYGRLRGNTTLQERAVDLFYNLPPEDNAIVRAFAQCNVHTRNAAGSQAQVELKSQYCDRRRCLECAIGTAILKRPAQV